MWNPSPESDLDSTNSSFDPASTSRASKDDPEFTFIGIKKPRYEVEEEKNSCSEGRPHLSVNSGTSSQTLKEDNDTTILDKPLEVEEEKNSCSEGHPHPLVISGTSSPTLKEDNDTTILDITLEEKLNSCSEDYPAQLVKSSTASFDGAQTSIDDSDVTILDSEKIHTFSECHPHPSVSTTSSSSNVPSLNDDADGFSYEDFNDGDDDNVVIQECPQCGEEFWEMSSFNFHIRTHDKSPKCLHCGKECHDKASYYSHVCDNSPTQTSDEQDSDDDSEEIQCYYCGKEFRNKDSYYSHSKTHESDESPTQSSDE